MELNVDKHDIFGKLLYQNETCYKFHGLQSIEFINAIQKKNIEIFHAQRSIDKEHVAELYNKQIKIYNNTKQFMINSTFCIGYNKQNCKYYLIDGQHRISVIQLIIKNGYKDIKYMHMIFEIYICKDDVELFEKFKFVNDIKPMELGCLNPSEIYNECVKYLRHTLKYEILKGTNLTKKGVKRKNASEFKIYTERLNTIISELNDENIFTVDNIGTYIGQLHTDLINAIEDNSISEFIKDYIPKIEHKRIINLLIKYKDYPIAIIYDTSIFKELMINYSNEEFYDT